MARATIYLNFVNQTEEAFTFYKEVFNGKFTHEVLRFGDAAPSDAERNLIMHMQIEIMDGFILMGSDAPASMGFELNKGNNFYINVEFDSRAETQRVFGLITQGGSIQQPLAEMEFDFYWGTCTDKFGVQWMVNTRSKV